MMHLKKLHIGLFKYIPGLRLGNGRYALRWLLYCFVILLLGYYAMRPATLLAHRATQTQEPFLVTQEFRYHMPEAGEVFLVWGVDGWQVIAEELRPAGTAVEGNVMHTPMAQEGDTFVTEVQVPASTSIDYCFLITKKRDAFDITWPLCDGDYQEIPSENSVTEIESTLTLGLVTQEIRYHIPEASEVYFVWGLNGWHIAPKELRPAGTEIKDEVMHTLMERKGDMFTTRVQVPTGTNLNYGFFVTEDSRGNDLEVWENGSNQDDPTIITEDDVLEVEATVTLAQNQASESALVTQEFRYHMPEAGEVFLVWGVNGWAMVPELIRPAGTVVKDAVMHTPMIREGDVFTAKVQTPSGTAIDYGFLITQKRGGIPIEAVWDGGDNQDDHMIITTQDNDVVEVESTLTLTQARELPTILDVGLYLLVGIGIVIGIGVILKYIPFEHSSRTVMLFLVGIMLVGLALRLWAAWDTNQYLPDTQARFVGDEPEYVYLATELLQGRFFQWPGRTPVYPLFLAASYSIFGYSYAKILYVQAFLGVVTIGLTFLLARRFIGTRNSLLAAALVALHPALILHVTHLYTEVLYTPLLLMTLLTTLWAVEKPHLYRIILGGALLAFTTLCRPTTALMPLILPVILPLTWSLRRRAIFCVVYVGAMAAVIAPWTYHNYLTYDRFLPLSASTYATWESSPEYYRLFEQGLTFFEIYDSYINPDNTGLPDPFSPEGSDYWAARSYASIRAEPGVYIWYSLKKLVYFWIGHPANHWEWPFNFEWMFRWLPAWQIAGVYISRLLPLIALVGLIILRHHLGSFIPLLAICAYFMLIHAILVPEARYSEPLHPLLVIIIVAAVSEGVRFYQKGRQQPSILISPHADGSA